MLMAVLKLPTVPPRTVLADKGNGVDAGLGEAAADVQGGVEAAARSGGTAVGELLGEIDIGVAHLDFRSYAAAAMQASW